MNPSDGFPNSLLEWIIVLAITGIAMALSRGALNAILCGFGATRRSRVKRANSFVARYSCALYVLEHSTDVPIRLGGQHTPLTTMLKENLEWAVQRSSDESLRLIWSDLRPWRPPHPTLCEIASSSVAGGLLKLNRHPHCDDWEPVVREVLRTS